MTVESGAEDTRSSSTASHDEPQLAKGRSISPWGWVPTVYFAQGLQYSVVVQLFAIVFFTMGIPAGDTLFWIGAVSFPWTIKPLWGPLVDKYGSKRTWTWLMQLLMAVSFVLAAGALLLGKAPVFGLPLFMVVCVVILAVAAFGAATHDIACDGFYMLGLSERRQAFFVGIRSTCFQLAMIFANGALIWMAGAVQSETGLPTVQSSVQVSLAREETGALLEMETWPAASGEEIQIMPSVLKAVAGEPAYMTVRLSAAPPAGDPRVVTLKSAGESAGITIPKEFTRLEFTANNWQRGVEVPLEIDPRLREAESETILAQAGNIPLSWSTVVLLSGLIFLCIAVWHRFVLPFPALDTSGDEHGNRPRFLTAAAWLGLTVATPLVVVWFAGAGIGLLRDDVRSAVIGEVASPALQDLSELLNLSEGAGDESITAAWSEIEAVRTAAPERGAAGLAAISKVRHILAAGETSGDEAMLAELAAKLEAIQADASLYGNPQLRHLLLLTTELNAGVAPQSREEFHAILSEAMQPAFARFDGDGSAKALAIVGSVEASLGGVLPETRAEFDAVVEQARETPSRLAVKGFDSLFSVVRILLLLALAAAVVRIPVLWRPVRAAAWRASEASGIGFAEVFATFFAKPGIAVTLGFLLTYRLGESQLSQIKNIFFLQSRDGGGLGLSLGDVALINSTTYLGLLTAGSLLGGMLIARFGLRKAVWPMVAFMHLPNLLYLWMSMTLPTAAVPVHLAVGIESFGHGFGFAAYLVIMMIAAQGPYKTAHYALCTGAMALGNMIPGMWAGYLQELVGYNTFFILVMVFTIPGTVLIPFLKLDMTFGGK
ncbi:MAG: transporter, family, beta-lactamase induction signal transducer AmpG [Candidatus Sumerlaeota bacterium]|nr:transporter, family, beta-lactamase induction signal transducer AmpG [Candidatus Sumerlaeota bacterium]